MTNKEQLSALMDAELDEVNERRLLQSLDDETRRTWERYHVIRAAMTRQLDALATDGFADRVMARLDGEASPEQRLKFWPLAKGFAVAASIAAVAVAMLQIFQPSPSHAPAVVTANVAQPQPVARLNESVPAPATAAATATVKTPAREEQLNSYLVGHNEFMPTVGIGGMLPYVRVVAHQQDK